ncbi:uncharacterized protein [Littorina saxatilis]|uniref:uncharacterized protein n=1 Tax=Littorina saxatilis TaxID=31220 RepID=UPI0038B61F5A
MGYMRRIVPLTGLSALAVRQQGGQLRGLLPSFCLAECPRPSSGDRFVSLSPERAERKTLFCAICRDPAMTFSRFVTSALLVIFVSACCVESEDCLESWVTCHEIQNKLRVESTIVCCEDNDLIPEVHTLADDAINCTCVSRMKHKYDVAIEDWATRTASQGRMCEYEESCRGCEGNSSINDKFTFCCRNQPSHTVITIYDGHNIEYIGCRCSAHAIPTNPEPKPYVVPETRLFLSSGETCSYNAMCDDHPSLACVSPLATFCCYGSRGMQLHNQDNTTTCTCTHEFFGKQCIDDVRPIPGSKIACMSTCGDKNATEKCRGEHAEERCCPDFMTVHATLRRGVFTDCTCSMDLDSKRCHDVDYMHEEHVYTNAAFRAICPVTALVLAVLLSLSQ